MAELVQHLAALANSAHPVLLLGERGAGKSHIAREIHRNSPRAQRAFVERNCAAITPTLAESTLFGHERGAFTGATSGATGLFREAHEGTLFLDEVADLPESVQAQLLLAVERRQVRPIGAPRDVPVDVRLISATNRDLGAGHLRLDLVDRLGVFQVRVPPLRERREDIPGLAQQIYREEVQQLLEREPYPEDLPDAVVSRLVEEQWPGNIRQLQNALRCLVTFNADGQLLGNDSEGQEAAINFAIEQAGGQQTAASSASVKRLPPGISLPEFQRRERAEYIESALALSAGNSAKAARLLGISRQAIQKYLSERTEEENS